MQEDRVRFVSREDGGKVTSQEPENKSNELENGQY